MLSESEALNLLRLSGVPVVQMESVSDCEDVAAAAERIGFPVVLKIDSPDIQHKSDIGGVVSNLRTPESVARAAQKMEAHVSTVCQKARLKGFTVQTVAQGAETLLSATVDPVFGPVLTFGLGGVWVEILEDVVFRLIPINTDDAQEIITEIKGRKLFEGFRGSPSVNREALIKGLVSLSDFLWKYSDEIAEIEINPLVAGVEGIIAVDGLVRLHG